MAQYSQKQANEQIEKLKAANAALEKAALDAQSAPFFQEAKTLPTDRQYPTWTFACPGKSLEAWNEGGRQGMLHDGPLVAVNSAIGVCPDADVWLITRIDQKHVLRDFGMTIDEILTSERAIWSNQGLWKRHFTRNGRDKGGVRKLYPNRKPAIESKLLGFSTRMEWSGTVPLGGVAVAISMGAKHLRLFGADMKGEGYAGIPKGPNAWRDNETTALHRRWMRDRVVLDGAILDCAEGGILLELGDTKQEIPDRTAPDLAQAKEAEEAKRLQFAIGGEAGVLGNRPLHGASPEKEEEAKRSFRNARDNMASMSEAYNAKHGEKA